MRADAKANRDAILVAARTAFGCHGPDVALSLIAERACTGIATLYRHFPTREVLIESVILDFAEQLTKIESQSSADFAADPETAWKNTVYKLAKLQPGALLPQLLEMFAENGTENSTHECSAVKAKTEEANDALERLITNARDAGLICEKIDSTMFQVGLAAITRPLTESPIPGCPTSKDWLIDLYIKGLKP